MFWYLHLTRWALRRERPAYPFGWVVIYRSRYATHEYPGMTRRAAIRNALGGIARG